MISFQPSEEQGQIIDMVRRFAGRGAARPNAHDCEEGKGVPDDLLAKFWELGLIANSIPEDCGGYGYERSALTGALIAEELAYGDLGLALAMLSPTFFAYPILETGTDEQMKKYLPEFCGEAFRSATAALMEPRVAFDPTILKTTAKREGGRVRPQRRKMPGPVCGSCGPVPGLCRNLPGRGRCRDRRLHRREGYGGPSGR